ncbi:MAG: hypothetical protein HC905_31810 [Bacteroidales bacterium]|nr:hypothetical protein [Bacteroidales bacterium]
MKVENESLFNPFPVVEVPGKDNKVQKGWDEICSELNAAMDKLSGRKNSCN